MSKLNKAPFIRGDVVQHNDGSIYILLQDAWPPENGVAYSPDETILVATVVEIDPPVIGKFWPSATLSCLKKLTHTNPE